MRFPRIIEVFHISQSSPQCQHDVYKDEVMESVSGARGTIWSMFSPPVGCVCRGREVLKNGGRQNRRVL